MTSTTIYAPFNNRTAFDVLWNNGEHGLTATDDELRQQATDGDLLAQFILDAANDLDRMDTKIIEEAAKLADRCDSAEDMVRRAYGSRDLPIPFREFSGDLDSTIVRRHTQTATLVKLVAIYKQREE